MSGARCRSAVGNRCWLSGNRLLFRQHDEQLLNLALLVGDVEAGLCHKKNSDIIPPAGTIGALLTVKSRLGTLRVEPDLDRRRTENPNLVS